jgi:predicted anti-sigma-YlaC factor YlaD
MAARVGRAHDGEASAAELAELQSHLVSCAACRDHAAALREISARIRGAELPAADAGLLARVREGAAAQVAQQQMDRRVRRLAGWLTAAAAAVMVVTSVWRPTVRGGGVTPGDAPAVATLSDIDTVMTRGSDEPPPATLVAARWMATDLSSGRGFGPGGRP